MRYSKRFIRLSISQVIGFGIAAVSFVYWAPWTAPLTVVEASQRQSVKRDLTMIQS